MAYKAGWLLVMVLASARVPERVAWGRVSLEALLITSGDCILVHVDDERIRPLTAQEIEKGGDYVSMISFDKAPTVDLVVMHNVVDFGMDIRLCNPKEHPIKTEVDKLQWAVWR